MKQDDLQYIIEKLENQVSKENAIFGIFQHGGASDESYIQADKEGLKLFALELLKAADQTDDITHINTKNIIPITFRENWIDERSDTVIHYVEPSNKRSSTTEIKKHKERLVEKLLPYGCLVVLAITIVALFVGFWSMIKWIF